MLLTVGELVSKSWRDYRANWHTWAVFGLLIFIPTFVVMLSGAFGGFLNLYVPATTIPTDILIGILVVISFGFAFWNTLALVNACIKFLQTKKTDHWKEHYAVSLSYFWPAFLTSFLVVLFVFLGTVLFVIPGIIISVWYYFSLYNVFTNGERGLAALESSKKLVRGRWWSVAWRIMAPSLLVGLPVILVQWSLDQSIGSLPISDEAFVLLNNVVQSIFSAMITPFTTLIWLNLYFNLRDNPFREPPILLATEPPADK